MTKILADICPPDATEKILVESSMSSKRGAGSPSPSCLCSVRKLTTCGSARSLPGACAHPNHRGDSAQADTVRVSSPPRFRHVLEVDPVVERAATIDRCRAEDARL